MYLTYANWLQWTCYNNIWVDTRAHILLIEDSIYSQRHSKRDLRTYAKSVDPDQLPRLWRGDWSGSRLFDNRYIKDTYISCCERNLNTYRCLQHCIRADLDLHHVKCDAGQLFLVCFNFESASISLKDAETVVWVVISLDPGDTTTLPYANSLDLDEPPSNSTSHQDPSCLTLRQHFHQLWATLQHFENWSRREI